MKTLNLASVLIISAVAVLPSLAAASSADRSAAACAQAFAAQLAATGNATPAYKLDYQRATFESSVAEYFATRYTFELSAREPKAKANIAHATCVTSRDGKILSLTTRLSGVDESKLAASM